MLADMSTLLLFHTADSAGTDVITLDQDMRTLTRGAGYAGTRHR
jgi:hypothetical protein